MKHGKPIGLALLQSWAELLPYFPVLVALYIGVPHMTLAFPLLLAISSGIYMLGYAFHYACPGARQWQSLLVAIAVPASCAWLVSGPPLGIALQFALWLLAWVRGRQSRVWGWDESFPSALLWIGLVGYFAASLLFPHFLATRPYAPWVTGLGIVTLAFAMYRGNRSTLDSESVGKTGESKPIVAQETKWRNRALVLATFAVIVLIAAIRVISEAVGRAVSFLFNATVDLLNKLMSLFASDETTPTRPPQEWIDGQLPAPEEPSAFVRLLEKLVYGIGVLLLLALAAGLLYVLGKHVRRWLKRFMGWYGERVEQKPETGYVDEKQSLLDTREWALDKARKWKQRIGELFRREPGWDDFADHRERIRHAYKRLLLDRIAGGYEHDATRTPRETGEEMDRRAPLGDDEAELIRLYEEARYSGRELSDEQAAKARALFRAERSGRK